MISRNIPKRVVSVDIKEMSKDLDYIISTEHPDKVQQQL